VTTVNQGTTDSPPVDVDDATVTRKAASHPTATLQDNVNAKTTLSENNANNVLPTSSIWTPTTLKVAKHVSVMVMGFLVKHSGILDSMGLEGK
jgi:uncharacterized heparinase superfamily protein